MSSIYGTELLRATGLKDIYYYSCEESEINGNSSKLVKAAAGLFIVVNMAMPQPAFSKDVVIPNIDNKPMIELVQAPIRMLETPKSDIKIGTPRPLTYHEVKLKSLDLYNRIERTQKLLLSYSKNDDGAEVPSESMVVMKQTNRLLSQLPFEDAILNYDKYEDAWQYYLYLPHHIELSIGVFSDMPGDVDFSVYQHSDLLVANTIKINQLVSKMKQILQKADRNA